MCKTLSSVSRSAKHKPHKLPSLVWLSQLTLSSAKGTQLLLALAGFHHFNLRPSIGCPVQSGDFTLNFLHDARQWFSPGPGPDTALSLHPPGAHFLFQSLLKALLFIHNRLRESQEEQVPSPSSHP